MPYFDSSLESFSLPVTAQKFSKIKEEDDFTEYHRDGEYSYRKYFVQRGTETVTMYKKVRL